MKRLSSLSLPSSPSLSSTTSETFFSPPSVEPLTTCPPSSALRHYWAPKDVVSCQLTCFLHLGVTFLKEPQCTRVNLTTLTTIHHQFIRNRYAP